MDIDFFKDRERDDLPEGKLRAVYHAHEMQFYHRELHQVMQQMSQIMKSRDQEKVERAVDQVDERVRGTAIELMHHTVLLGDELGIIDKDWPETPIDRGAWHRKLRRLLGHIVTGDACKVGEVCECLGGMLSLAKHTMTLGGATNMEDAIDAARSEDQ